MCVRQGLWLHDRTRLTLWFVRWGIAMRATCHRVPHRGTVGQSRHQRQLGWTFLTAPLPCFKLGFGGGGRTGGVVGGRVPSSTSATNGISCSSARRRRLGSSVGDMCGRFVALPGA